MNELERAMLEFIANGEKPEDFPRVIEARNRALGEKSEYIEKPIIEEVVGETAEPQEKPIKDMTSEIISREKYLERATLLSANGNLEDMGKITELHNKYFEGLEATITKMKELENAKQKEKELKLKISEIENIIRELKEKIKAGGLSEEELKNINAEIGELSNELENYKNELVELSGLLHKDMEKEIYSTYGVRSLEDLERVLDEDKKREKVPSDMNAERKPNADGTYGEKLSTSGVHDEVGNSVSGLFSHSSHSYERAPEPRIVEFPSSGARWRKHLGCSYNKIKIWS